MMRLLMTRVSVSLHRMLEESLSQSYVPGAFRMAERSALRRHLPDIDIPPSKPSAHIRERQAVMEIEAIGV